MFKLELRRERRADRSFGNVLATLRLGKIDAVGELIHKAVWRQYYRGDAMGVDPKDQVAWSRATQSWGTWWTTELSEDALIRVLDRTHQVIWANARMQEALEEYGFRLVSEPEFGVLER